MRNLPKAGIALMLLGFVAVGAMILVQARYVEARPQYMKVFKDKYGMELKDANCAVCHPTKDKKERNAYGKKVAEVLGAKNVKDGEKIAAALEKVAGEKNDKTGKTFGDMIKAGKLPSAE